MTRAQIEGIFRWLPELEAKYFVDRDDGWVIFLMSARAHLASLARVQQEIEAFGDLRGIRYDVEIAIHDKGGRFIIEVKERVA